MVENNVSPPTQQNTNKTGTFHRRWLGQRSEVAFTLCITTVNLTIDGFSLMRSKEFFFKIKILHTEGSPSMMTPNSHTTEYCGPGCFWWFCTRAGFSSVMKSLPSECVLQYECLSRAEWSGRRGQSLLGAGSGGFLGNQSLLHTLTATWFQVDGGLWA